MIKICMLSTGHSPVDDRIYYKEVLSLAKQYDSLILVMPWKESRLAELKQRVSFLSLGQPGSLLSRFFFIPKSIVKVLQIRPDVCHFHDYELIFTLPFLRMFSRCKIIYDVHEVYPEMILQSSKIPEVLRPYLSKAVDITEKILSRLAHYIITSDENITMRFSKQSTKVATIFNYPKLSLFKPDNNRVNELRKLYAGKIPIIYQGSISKERGLFNMLEAMVHIHDKQPDVVLLIVGSMSESLMQDTLQEINKKKLNGAVQIVGSVPHHDVVNYISIAKIGLVPFLPTQKFMKNIPIKQFEYMACGVPVLGSDLPPITSYINKAACGRVYRAGNSEALAYQALDMLNDEVGWKHMSDAGRRAVQETWNWDKMEEKLFDVYKELLGAS